MAIKGDVGSGVAVIVRHHGRVLIGRRRGSHLAGLSCFPGGHIDYGESWEEAAARETLEETGLVVEDLQAIAVANTLMPHDRLQYTTIYLTGRVRSVDGLRHEPAKNEGWQWVDPAAIPGPHMTPAADLLRMGLGPLVRDAQTDTVRRDFILVGTPLGAPTDVLA